jgi:hypothetical protein
MHVFQTTGRAAGGFVRVQHRGGDQQFPDVVCHERGGARARQVLAARIPDKDVGTARLGAGEERQPAFCHRLVVRNVASEDDLRPARISIQGVLQGEREGDTVGLGIEGDGRTGEPIDVVAVTVAAPAFAAAMATRPEPDARSKTVWPATR